MLREIDSSLVTISDCLPGLLIAGSKGFLGRSINYIYGTNGTVENDTFSNFARKLNTHKTVLLQLAQQSNGSLGDYSCDVRSNAFVLEHRWLHSVYVSSAKVYAQPYNNKETSPLDDSSYAASKLKAESLFRNFGTVLRIPTVVNPVGENKLNFFGLFQRALMSEVKLRFLDDNPLQIITPELFVRVMFWCLNHCPRGTYNLASNQCFNKSVWCEKLSAMSAEVKDLNVSGVGTDSYITRIPLMNCSKIKDQSKLSLDVVSDV